MLGFNLPSFHSQTIGVTLEGDYDYTETELHSYAKKTNRKLTTTVHKQLLKQAERERKKLMYVWDQTQDL